MPAQDFPLVQFHGRSSSSFFLSVFILGSHKADSILKKRNPASVGIFSSFIQFPPALADDILQFVDFFDVFNDALTAVNISSDTAGNTQIGTDDLIDADLPSDSCDISVAKLAGNRFFFAFDARLPDEANFAIISTGSDTILMLFCLPS